MQEIILKSLTFTSRKEERQVPAAVPSLERPSTVETVQPLVLSFVAIEPITLEKISDTYMKNIK